MTLKKLVHNDHVIDGAHYYKEYPEDTARIVAAFREAGYDVSPQDAALAWHHAGEDTHCAGWLMLGDGSPAWNMPAMMEYLRPADDDETVKVLERALAGVTASFEEADAQRLALTQALREAILAHARSGNVAGPLMRGAKLLHNMGVKL